MPVATETFRLRLGKGHWIDARKSHFSRVFFRIPDSSAPTTNAIFPLQSILSRDCEPSKTAPTTHTSYFFKVSRQRDKFTTWYILTRLAAPLAVLIAASLRGAERSLDTITPSTPKFAADRRHAPKLRGSVTPSRTRNSNFEGFPAKYAARSFQNAPLAALLEEKRLD